MSRLKAFLLIISLFAVFYVIIPFVLISIGIGYVPIYTVSRWIGAIAVPILMIKAFEEKGVFIAIAYIFLFANLLYFFYEFLIGLNIYGFNLYIIYIFIPPVLFVLGLLLYPAYYCRMIMGFVLGIAAIAMYVAFSIQGNFLVQVIITETQNELIPMFSIRQLTFVIFFILEYLTLDQIMVERSRYY